MAVETTADAYLPVAIVLIKLHFESIFELFFPSINDKSAPIKKETDSPTVDLDSSWDLYLMAALLGLIGALYTIRRQRTALRRQAGQLPVQ
jgi:hypothetical protein